MQSEIKQGDIKPVKSKYPVLKQFTSPTFNKNMVVLFTAPMEGVVVAGDLHDLGSYSKSWAEESYFSPFNDKVVLQND